jgi:hypothetical protein
MTSNCRKCYGLTRDEERSWTTHAKNQAGAAIADAMAGYDQSELHFVTVMHSHEGFHFDPHARTTEFQAKLERALNGSDVTASGLMEIQPSIKSGLARLDFHHHGVMATKMSRSELRKRLHQVWTEAGQVVIQDVDPEKGGCAGIGSYAVKERIMIPPEVAALESASEIALQMMMIWSAWKIEDRHIHVGCDQMIMTPIEPQDRGIESGHRKSHGSIPPCGGRFIDDADAYWARYEEVGDLDDGSFITASSDDCDEPSFDEFCVKSDVGFVNKTRMNSLDSLIYSPCPSEQGQNSPANAPSRASGIARTISLPDHGSKMSSTIVEDSRTYRSNSEYLDA